MNFRYLEAFLWTQRTAAVVKTLKTLTKINLNYNKWQYIKLSSFKKWSLVFYYIYYLPKDKGWWEEKLSEKQQDQKLSTAVIDKSFNDFYFIDLLFKISQKCLKIVKNISIKTSRDSRAFKHLVESEQQIQTTLKTQEQNTEKLFMNCFHWIIFCPQVRLSGYWFTAPTLTWPANLYINCATFKYTVSPKQCG